MVPLASELLKLGVSTALVKVAVLLRFRELAQSGRLKDLKVNSLKSFLKSKNQRVDGKKDDLIARVVAFLEATIRSQNPS